MDGWPLKCAEGVAAQQVEVLLPKLLEPRLPQLCCLTPSTLANNWAIPVLQSGSP